MGEYCGCHEGWVPLIEDAIRLVRKYNLQHPDKEPLGFSQIKEKWGYLRIYLNCYDVPGEIREGIRELDKKSAHICERCGTSENVETKPSPSWVQTLCSNCRKKLYEERGIQTDREA